MKKLITTVNVSLFGFVSAKIMSVLSTILYSYRCWGKSPEETGANWEYVKILLVKMQFCCLSTDSMVIFASRAFDITTLFISVLPLKLLQKLNPSQGTGQQRERDIYMQD